jgi:inositol phosphorylceramide synthase catalytic subunit
LENIFYGANLSNILSAHKHWILDVLAWLPYGITHFGAPFVCSAIMFVFGPPGTVPTFARSFGYMNLAGVTIQLLFPTSAPWYENMYGLAPANYSMQGSPAGLAAIDKLFGIEMYTSTFTASPLVFGAFPSLHAGNATIEALFMSHCFPKLRPLFVCYVLWICWATMYLSHHYAVDLVAGSFRKSQCLFLTLESPSLTSH